jgi:hypothetical protein
MSLIWEGRAPRVRPYMLVGGRTRHVHVLLVETLVTTLDCPQDDQWDMPEARTIIDLCRTVRSVADRAVLERVLSELDKL